MAVNEKDLDIKSEKMSCRSHYWTNILIVGKYFILDPQSVSQKPPIKQDEYTQTLKNSFCLIWAEGTVALDTFYSTILLT